MTAQPLIPVVTLGEEIRKARTDAGLDQQELASKLGVSRPLVSKWERNVSEPTATQLRRMAQLLNAQWLLAGLYSHFQTGATNANAKFREFGRRRDDMPFSVVATADRRMELAFTAPPTLAAVDCEQ